MHITPSVVSLSLEEANAKAGKTVTLVAPKAFMIRDDDNTVLSIPQGTHEVPEWVGAHWFTAAHGATVYVKPEAPEAPVTVKAPRGKSAKAAVVIADDQPVDPAPVASVESSDSATSEA